jgi:hypothetical protein
MSLTGADYKAFSGEYLENSCLLSICLAKSLNHLVWLMNQDKQPACQS